MSSPIISILGVLVLFLLTSITPLFEPVTYSVNLPLFVSSDKTVISVPPNKYVLNGSISEYVFTISLSLIFHAESPVAL